VTAPSSWTPSVPVEPAPPLVVRPDRAKARSWLATILFLNGFLAVVCLLAALWASSTSIGVLGGASFAITLSGCVFQMVFHAYYWGRFLGADVVAEVGPHGIRALVPGEGTVFLPWPAVASTEVRWRALTIRFAPGVAPSSPGVEAAVSEHTWRRVSRRGIALPVKAISPDVAVLRAAIQHFTGGRL